MQSYLCGMQYVLFLKNGTDMQEYLQQDVAVRADPTKPLGREAKGDIQKGPGRKEQVQ